MRKFIVAIAALLWSVSAQAHVSAVPFPEIGSLRDVTERAAFFMPQTYLPNATRGDVICDISTGIATGVGAGTCIPSSVPLCNGDVQTRTLNITSVNFSNIISVDTNTFVNATTPAGDVGKTILIPNAALSGTYGVITAVGAFSAGKQDITLSIVSRANNTGVASTVTYGTDDAPGFGQFQLWGVQTWQASHTGLVEMYIPPGKTCQLISIGSVTTSSSFDPGCATPTTYGFNCGWSGAGWSKGFKKLLVNFSGSSIGAPVAPTTEYALAATDGVCHQGLQSTNGCTALTASANIGDTSVTLLDTSLCSRFTVGNYVIMAGFDTQGGWKPSPGFGGFGYPPNPGFYDYAKVTSLASCAGSGVVNLDRALTNNYLSTWPRNCQGGSGEADCNGPATLYALAFWWDGEWEYRGGTFAQQVNQVNDAGRKVLFTNITWSSTGASTCAYPTQAIDWTVTGGDWTACQIEMDKMVVNATMQNTSIDKIHYFSMSPRNTFASNTTFRQLSGSGRNGTFSNVTVSSTADISTGVSSFGRGDSWNCTNCTMNGAIGIGGPTGTGTVTASVWGLQDQVGTPFNSTMSAGVITVPNTHGSSGWSVPGQNFSWNYSSAVSVYMYQILSVTQDATNQYITTNCVGVNTVCGAGGGFPISSGSLTLRAHPAPIFNCTNCTGSRQWSAVSNGPTNAPLFSYAKYNVDVTWPTATAAAYQFIVWGSLTSIVATVNTPYAGGGVLNWKPTGQFLYTVYSQTGTSGSYVPSVDLKTSGTRTLLPGGTGGIGADTNTVPFAAPQWFAITTQGVLSSQPAWAGNADITITTNQGVVNP
jgi:hypothetical protein